MIRRTLVLVLSFCLLAVLVSACNQIPDKSAYPKAITTARTEIWKALSIGTASSATVAIMDDSKIVYAEGFGMRNREKSLPVDTNTQFNIGSVSKIFTASAVLLLCDDGKVHLDEPVTTYLPDFTMKDPRYKDITVRMLLNHSSGFPGTNMRNGFAAAKDENYVKETLDLLKESTLKSNPGESSIYCNDGLTVAQAVIERVSGMSYADFLKKRIFSKLGMDHTSCYFKDGNSNIALSYNAQKDGPYPEEYVNIMASGGLSSTAEDLCRFSQVLYSDNLFKPDTLAEYEKPQFAPKTMPVGKPLYQYGLGWDTVSIEKFQEEEVTVLSKNGGTLEYTSHLYVAPQQKLSVAVIFAGRADTGTINDKIFQALLEDKNIVKSSQDKATFPLKIAHVPDNFKNYEGYYGRNGEIIKVQFDTEKSTLDFSVFKDGSFVPDGTYPYKEDGYFYMDDKHRLSFTGNYGTKFILLHMADTKGGIVYAENIKSAERPARSSAFDGKLWVPRDLSATDFSGSMIKTGLINDLPGYIYLYDGGYTPYELTSETSAKMSLKYARDLTEPQIVNQNNDMMMEANGYIFSDAAQADDLQQGEKVTINATQESEVRRINQDAIFKSSIPENGRIIIFSPEQKAVYDSLIDGVQDTLLSANSYIVFIGDAGASFQTAESMS